VAADLHAPWPLSGQPHAVISQAIRRDALELARLHTEITSLRVYGAYARATDEEGLLITFDTLLKIAVFIPGGEGQLMSY
jgi:hypothetical protein